MTKWSDDAFLDEMRSQSDRLANDCVRQLAADGVRMHDISKVFRQMTHNGAVIPDGTPSALRSFLEETSRVPDGTDHKRLRQGQAAFLTHALPGCLALLLKSIPEGYAAPSLARVLNISGQLRDNPYHRLMGTLHFLIDVSAPDAFAPGPASHTDVPTWKRGHRGIVTTQQVRLMHGGVRTNVAPRWPDYESYRRQHGDPINLEDMLGTMIGFSMLVVIGLRSLRVSMGTPVDGGSAEYSDDEEAYYYVWRTFGRMFGIYPDGQPESDDFIPQNLTEAREFYAAYRRRHYVGATDFSSGWRKRSEEANPGGVALADAHVRMMGAVVKHLLPRPLRPLVPGPAARLVPRIYLRFLIGDTGCARIGVRPVTLFFVLKWLLFEAPSAWARLWGTVDPQVHVRVSSWFLQHLIKMMYVKPPGFIIPSNVDDLVHLVEEGSRT